MKQLEGKVAVVTGGASGIGRALAGRFAEEGMKVVLADVEPGPLEAAVAEIREAGGTAIGVPTDVRDPDAIEALAGRTMLEFDAVHVLCNNAGVETGGRFADIPLSSWRWVLDVDLYGAIYGCRTFLPLIRRQGEGHIVNTGSVASFSTEVATFHPYVTAKFGLLGLSESLERELVEGGEDIGVSILAPGMIKTNMVESERNRPADVPASDTDPARRPIIDALNQAMEQEGMEPTEVAALVVDAIHERRFFVLTHPELALDAVRERLGRMETGG